MLELNSPARGTEKMSESSGFPAPRKSTRSFKWRWGSGGSFSFLGRGGERCVSFFAPRKYSKGVENFSTFENRATWSCFSQWSVAVEVKPGQLGRSTRGRQHSPGAFARPPARTPHASEGHRPRARSRIQQRRGRGKPKTEKGPLSQALSQSCLGSLSLFLLLPAVEKKREWGSENRRSVLGADSPRQATDGSCERQVLSREY